MAFSGVTLRIHSRDTWASFDMHERGSYSLEVRNAAAIVRDRAWQADRTMAWMRRMASADARVTCTLLLDHRIHGVLCHCLLRNDISLREIAHRRSSRAAMEPPVLHRLAFHPTFYGPEHRFVQW